MRLATVAATIFVAGIIGTPAQAVCFGTGAFQSCTDSYGNSYTRQRLGNQTFMQGNNARTGSRWSQTTTTLGNSTFTNGRAANGNNWNMTGTRLGNTTIYSGRNSRGRPFSFTCNRLFGCN